MSDPTAQIAALYTAYQGRVFGLLYHITGNQADAEDLTQETFLRAFRALGHTETDAHVLRWLQAIARNLARDRARWLACWATVPFDPAQHGRVDARTPDAALLRRDGARDLRALIDALPPDYRAVLLLTAAGADLATQARLLHRSPGAVKLLRFRARRAAQRALRARLAEYV